MFGECHERENRYIVVIVRRTTVQAYAAQAVRGQVSESPRLECRAAVVAELSTYHGCAWQRFMKATHDRLYCI